MRRILAGLALVAAACGDAGDPDAVAFDGGVDDIDAATGPRCTRDRDCGDPVFGAFGPCVYATECITSGARTRLVMMPVCDLDSGACNVETVPETESASCDRATEAHECEDTGVTYCGVAAQCKECRSGVCVVNSPNFDSACHPSCGQAGAMCGEAPMCCPGQDTCPLGTVGPGPWEAVCPVCCIESC